jgi:glycerophosphoryl diester phosphodiesterase
MQIISHRGYWKQASEKNTRLAFERSFNLGYGTETDVRDCAGKLLISHDPPSGNEITLDELLEIAGPSQPMLALNIKADGLAVAVREAMQKRRYPNWFVFDMSIPDTRMQLAAGNPVYTRCSELEAAPVFFDEVGGIWLDAFEDDAWRIDAAKHFLGLNKKVCLVSPELHKRPHKTFWKLLRDASLHHAKNLMMCTDLPEQATDFFKETHD